MASRIGRAFQTVGKIVLFFSLWLIMAIVPVAAWERPLMIGDRPGWLRLYWEVAPLVLTVILTYLFVVVIDKGRVQVTMSRYPLRDTFLGVGVGMVWVATVSLVLWRAGFLSVEATITTDLFGVYALALLANTWTQELLVHGYVFSYLQGKHTTTVAVIVTTVLFAALHAGALSAGVLPTLNVLATGVFFAALLIASKGIWLPVLVHFSWNLLGGMVLGLVVLGEDQHLLRTSLSGPAWINGGSAMLEGSAITLAVTIILTMLTVVISRTNRARRFAKAPPSTVVSNITG
ncbi:MAG: CPBP family intramembrane metalloprotease [Intrasporangiaceae bacterium]|nr:CPBP family intramembrane metalloprotease [Intrasporangiaceae bacterium]